MHGFSSKVTNLLQTLREGEREKVLAQLDPQIAEKLKERRQKERRDPGEGGINPERSKSESKARHSGVPDYDPANALVESAGKVYKQNNPEDGEFSEDQSDPFDYATCQRPDGSTYGTGGQCRKGKETTPTEKGSEFRTRPKGAIEADMRKLTSSGAMLQKGIAGVRARQQHEALKAELAKPLASKPKAADSAKAKEIAALESRIQRQERFLRTADPSKYSRKEIEIEKKELQRMKSQLAGMKSTTKEKAPVAPTPPKSAMTERDPVASVLRSQKETKDFLKEDNKRLAQNEKLMEEVKAMRARKAALKKAQES